MTSSSFVGNLRRFDSHERGLLLQWVAGEPFRVGGALRSAISRAVGIEPPADAFVAMDYTLDWLYAAVQATLAEDDSLPQPWPSKGELAASPEDVDLIVAWEGPDGCAHLILIEAKGFTGWSNTQLKRKVMRLDSIFAGELRNRFDVHLFLAGPQPSAGLKITDWPEWTRPDGRTRFLAIDDPGLRYAVQRCDGDGRPTSRHWTHWKAVPRRWQTAQAADDTMADDAAPTSRRRTCSRCGGLADWLVVARYNLSTQTGRLLIYCDRCKQDVANRLGAVLPLSLLDDDPNTVLSLLYKHKATASAPESAAGVIGVAFGPWVEVARREIG
ncbi:hypothetical protein [Kribbella sp. CA-247076]|uniref:hypothetical protein n=1 Tax=Kribbella sp. CA-247076 TaxID=3239941 RepID=UPI003D9194B9